MQTLIQDLKFALRMMRKAPGFTIVAVLALGLGVNTAILSTVNGFILRPLPIEKPKELMMVFWGRKSDPQVWNDFSYLNYRDVRQQNKSFTDIAAWNPMNSASLSTSESRNAGDSGRAEISWGETVSGNYFDVMGVKPILGRDFTDRDTADAPPVVIVNQQFARKFFGSEQNALGKRFRFWTGTPLMEIIGIAQDGYYDNLYEDRRTFMFLPEYQNYQSQMTLLVSAHSAGNLKTIAENVRREIGQMDARIPVFGVIMAEENMTYAYWGPRLAAGMASTCGVLALLLATMGLYSMMTYAVSQRTREIGIRMALGAQIRDVLRLIVTQGMRMVLIGIALGLISAFALTRVLATRTPRYKS